MIRKKPRLRTAALAAMTTAAIYTSLPAYAADQAAKVEELQEVVITGSRILRPNLESSVPVTSVGGEEVFQTGDKSVGDLLANLPAIRSTFNQSNSSRYLGTAGLNLLDLRGLGTQRTLVMVNGRRHVGGDILNNAVSPDVNTMPSELIERVDVVTGGSSAVYGSDAIAGVVNFVLKKNYEGMQVRAQGGQSKYHDGNNAFVSFVGGKNFADGKGNVAVDVEYSDQRPVFGSNRPNLAANKAFVTVDTDPAGTAFGSDGVPDATLVNDIRTTSVAIGGLLQFTPAAGLSPCGTDKDGAAYRCMYIFQPDGSFVAQTGTRVGLAPSGSFSGGNGTTGREGTTLGVFPALNRLSFNLLGHYTVSDAFEPFVEAKFVRTTSRRYGTPAFFQGTTIGQGDVREKPRYDNPYLSATALAQINAARVAAGSTAVSGAALATTRMSLFKNLTDIGGRNEEATRDTSRIVLGATGKLASDWSYEASFNYGQLKESTRVLGNVNTQHFLLAIDSARDSNNNIVCRSQIDPAARIITPTATTSVATDLLNADVAACVPLNPFGAGNITPAMRNYLVSDTTSVGYIKQIDALAFVSGNTAQWFSLPAGPIGISAGAEYRNEKNFFKEDPLVSNGMTFYNAIADYTPPSLGVSEYFGELLFPLLKDKPLFKDLSLTVAGRSSSYSGQIGKVSAYNGGLEWAPISDLRLRGNVARAIRGPNLAELYTAQGQNYGTVGDPCSLRNIGTGTATRAANCRAAGIPANYDFFYTQSLGFLSGGNPALKAETSDSTTIGAVIQPRFLPDFSLSVDLYNIKVKDAIASVSAQNILNLCYDSTSLNNVYCSMFKRNGTGTGPKGEVAYQVLENSLLVSSVNYAALEARGVDAEAAYKFQVNSLGSFDTRVVYTHVLKRNNYLDVVNPWKYTSSAGALGDPKDAFNFDLNFKRDKLTLGAKIRYLGRMPVASIASTYSVQGRDPENADASDTRFYPSIWYTDLRAGYEVSKTLNVYASIDNVANRIPPLGGTGTGDGTGIYDAMGRFFSFGFKANLR